MNKDNQLSVTASAASSPNTSSNTSGKILPHNVTHVAMETARLCVRSKHGLRVFCVKNVKTAYFYTKIRNNFSVQHSGGSMKLQSLLKRYKLYDCVWKFVSNRAWALKITAEGNNFLSLVIHSKGAI